MSDSSPKQGMQYRLALGLGPTSLGWSLFRIRKNVEGIWQPYALIKAGVRIFSDGRNPKDGASLAVSRRAARALRRRRDRLLKRKARMLSLLVKHNFFPQDQVDRKRLEAFNPYELRAKGLDKALTPGEFARALFHINQRRGFQSNRKTDAKKNDAGAMKAAINTLKNQLDINTPGHRTVGEWLWRRYQEENEKARKCKTAPESSVRARYRKQRGVKNNGKTKIEKRYDLYIDRSMIVAEFDALWQVQAKFNPKLFNEAACAELKDCLLFQRPLNPVKPGRCTLLPDEERAPLALPSTQRFRIYQEVISLRILDDQLHPQILTIAQRDAVVNALEKNAKRTFEQIAKLLKLPDDTQFNLEDFKQQELKGNATSAVLKKDALFGKSWLDFPHTLQDEIVTQLLSEESETKLIDWLVEHTGVDETHAHSIASAGLPEGYGNLSAKALARILPALREPDEQGLARTYDKAVLAAGFDNHSAISHATTTGEILSELPYYGEYLQRHVGFGSGDVNDPPEKRFGRIANPTVHIGLNQTRTVVNALIKRYGHPEEVVIEVARALKQTREQSADDQRKQAENQKRNEGLRKDIAKELGVNERAVKRADVEKMILWAELNPHNAADRRCPYSGEQISLHRLLSDEVEIEHILPFSMTLDDSLNNKTVALRRAKRIKGNRTPWDAQADFEREGWANESMMQRVLSMPKEKRYRFGPDGYELWLRGENNFLFRALNDTRYLSRVAREYLTLICTPRSTRVIPGQMTGLLRTKLGLNDILGHEGIRNREDHRHHAVDACVIGITDQGILQRFAKASAVAMQEGREATAMTEPAKLLLGWPSYRAHVQRAIDAVKVSHRPYHGYEGSMHNDTAYGLLDHGEVHVHKRNSNGGRENVKEKLSVIEMTEPQAMALQEGRMAPRHGLLPNGNPRPYKGYKGDSNYCMEITRDKKGKWQSRVVSTFEAYQCVRQQGEAGKARLRDPRRALDGRPLVMRLMRNDCVKLEIEEQMRLMRVAKLSSNGDIYMAPIYEANVDARNRDKDDPFKYTTKTASSLFKAQGRRVTISPTGEVNDPGFHP